MDSSSRNPFNSNTEFPAWFDRSLGDTIIKHYEFAQKDSSENLKKVNLNIVNRCFYLKEVFHKYMTEKRNPPLIFEKFQITVPIPLLSETQPTHSAQCQLRDALTSSSPEIKAITLMACHAIQDYEQKACDFFKRLLPSFSDDLIDHLVSVETDPNVLLKLLDNVE